MNRGILTDIATTRHPQDLDSVNNVFPATMCSCLIKGGRISCPECRQQHVWTKNWEQRFPRNFYLETEETDDNPKEDVTQERMCSIHRKRITMFCDANNCQVRFYQLEVHSHCATANVRPKSLPDGFLGTAIYCSHRVAIKMKEKFSFCWCECTLRSIYSERKPKFSFMLSRYSAIIFGYCLIFFRFRSDFCLV